MSASPIRLLLVEDNAADAVLLKHLLSEVSEESFHVAHVQRLDEALACLAREPFDAILLDLSLPDSQGICTVAQANAAAPHLPIVVMTGLDDEATAIKAVRRGAQDFLVKGHGDGRLLARAIRYAMERKQVEHQLKTLNETLEQRVAERTAVATRRAAQLQALASELTRTEHRERRRLAQILHDHLQQLLYAARLSLGTLRRGAQRDPAEDEAIARVDELLNQSLDVSRSLTVELSPPVLYEAGLAAALEWLGRHMQERCGLAVDVEADADADPESEDLCILLFEATRELLFNVMKHARTGAARVRMTPVSRDELQLVVSDEGAGLNPQALQEARDTRGGFGLFSIRERLESWGGRLEVEGALGEGARVTIVAPRCRPDLSVAESSLAGRLAAGSDQVASPSRPARGNGRIRVLLADDQPVLIAGLTRLLQEQTDIELVATASDGRTAVELALHQRPDVAVLDVSMPDLSGIEVTRRLTAALPGIRVIGLSALEEQDVALAMRAAGAAAYLSKNGSPEALIAAIRAHPGPSQQDHYHDHRKRSQEAVVTKIPHPAGR